MGIVAIKSPITGLRRQWKVLRSSLARMEGYSRALHYGDLQEKFQDQDFRRGRIFDAQISR